MMLMYGLFIVVFSLHAMENHQERIFPQDITSRFNLGQNKDIINLGFRDANTMNFLVHVHSNSGCTNRFGSVSVSDDDQKPIIYHNEVSDDHVMTSKNTITRSGKFLLNYINGQISYYDPKTNHDKTWHFTDSAIVALQKYKYLGQLTVAAVDEDGNLFAITGQEEKKVCNLFHDVKINDKRNDQMIFTADIKRYSSNYILPFVAFALRYKTLAGIEKYSKNILVYNCIKNKITVFNGYEGHIMHVGFLPNYNVCAASDCGAIHICNPFKAQKLYTIKCLDQPINPCGGFFAQGLFNFNFFTLQTVSRATPSPCGRYIASIDVSGYLCLWDVNSGARYSKIQLLNLNGGPWCLCKATQAKIIFSPDSTRLCVFTRKQQIIYKLQDLVEPIEFSAKEQENAVRNFRQQHNAQQGTPLVEILRRRELGINPKSRYAITSKSQLK